MENFTFHSSVIRKFLYENSALRKHFQVFFCVSLIISVTASQILRMFFLFELFT